MIGRDKFFQAWNIGGLWNIYSCHDSFTLMEEPWRAIYLIGPRVSLQ
jgi:hypothetical protein